MYTTYPLLWPWDSEYPIMWDSKIDFFYAKSEYVRNASESEVEWVRGELIQMNQAFIEVNKKKQAANFSVDRTSSLALALVVGDPLERAILRFLENLAPQQMTDRFLPDHVVETVVLQEPNRLAQPSTCPAVRLPSILRKQLLSSCLTNLRITALDIIQNTCTILLRQLCRTIFEQNVHSFHYFRIQTQHRT